jgi:halimadienyl-diphosphate synthase
VAFERLSVTSNDPLAFAPGAIVVAPVAYDTAIVGQVRDQHGRARFPLAGSWLLAHQAADGTWGSQAWHAHDRLVSTLAAILCLKAQPGNERAIERGLMSIPRLLVRLDADAHETVGFELIAPALLDQCSQLGWPIPRETLPHQRRRRAARLAAGAIGTAAFSLEALGDIPKDIAAWISPRGSLFASPAAAAAYLAQYPATAALADSLTWLATQHNGGIPAVHPLDSFVAAWTCWHMQLAGLGHLPDVQRLRKSIERSWTAQGASFSDDFAIPNADDTALSMIVQHQEELLPDIAVFAPYITPQGVRCYLHEYDPSVSTNVHVLMALRLAPPGRERDTWIGWILAYLRQARTPEGMFTDKWHASPLYVTSHAVLATYRLDDALCDALTEAILRSQHANGAWGLEGGSAEETAYALLALCTTYRPAMRAALASGVAALERLATQPRPALWIGKSLYRPTPVVESAILAAWHLGHARLSASA